MTQSKTAARTLDTATRRVYVLNLRKAGMTYAEIAAATLRKFGEEQLPSGWDERYAHKDVKRELDKLQAEIAESVDDIRQMELERLNDLLKGLWPQVAKSNPKLPAVDRVLRVMDRRAKLMGLDAPTKSEITGEDGNALTIRVEYVEAPTTEAT